MDDHMKCPYGKVITLAISAFISQNSLAEDIIPDNKKLVNGVISNSNYDLIIDTNQPSTVHLDSSQLSVLISQGVSISTSGEDSIRLSNSQEEQLIVNQGVIESYMGHGITTDSFDAQFTFNNERDAILRTDGEAIYASGMARLSVNNHGQIISLMENGIYAGSFSSTNHNISFENDGLIQGALNGIRVSGSSVFNNLFGGSIIGLDGHGIDASDDNNYVTNHFGGVISGKYSGIHTGGIDAYLTVDNSGEISGVDGAGVLSYGGGVITNNATGVIEGAGGISYPRAIGSVGTIDNSGIIRGNSELFIAGNDDNTGSGVGIYFGDSTAQVNNYQGGLIEGTHYGIYNGYASDISSNDSTFIHNEGEITGNVGISLNYSSNGHIENSGVITGFGGVAIEFEQSDAYFTGTQNFNSLTLKTGSVINGKVVGGAGLDSLLLFGSGTEDGSKFVNFETLTLEGVQWTLSSNSVFSQNVDINNGLLILDGSLTTPSVNIYQQGVLAGAATINGNLTNGGALSPSGDSQFSIMTINGNYIGNSGVLLLNTSLGDDSSSSDRLVVNGDISGTTSLVIKNSAGNGALTNKGILLVDNANGSSTDDAFSLSSASTGYRISTETLSVGGFDYHLAKGGNNGQQQSWYLVSSGGPMPPDPAPMPTPTPNDTTQVSPESGSWLGNKYAAQTMFIQTLHDRAGEPLYGNGNTSFWLRTQGTRMRNADAAGGLIGIDTNKVATQFGVGLWDVQQGSQTLQAGLMFGYGNAHTTSTSSLVNSKTGQNVGVSAKGNVDGYSAGAYGTWYQDSASRLGSYVDVWGLYGWYQNELNSEIGSADYHSKVLNLSLEAGYAVKPFSDSDFIMEPQAQVIYTNYQADDTTLAGTRYRNHDDNLVTTRLGARWYITGKQYQPFVETNWIYSTKDNAVVVGSQTFSSDSAKSILELKVGVNGQVTPNLQLYGNIAEQLSASNADFSQFGGQVGIKYHF
ncbi:hypothetical protein SOASR029_37890 [Budvicia aquatica]|nr:hypothetical protein SOASR029_37890 [Budvicia aquatica]